MSDHIPEAPRPVRPVRQRRRPEKHVLVLGEPITRTKGRPMESAVRQFPERKAKRI